MSSELLLTGLGAVLSLIFLYAPKLRDKFDALESNQKRWVMLALLTALSAGFFVLSCANIAQDLFGVSTVCGKTGVIDTVKAFVNAAIANQATYLVAPRLKKQELPG